MSLFTNVNDTAQRSGKVPETGKIHHADDVTPSSTYDFYADTATSGTGRRAKKDMDKSGRNVTLDTAKKPSINQEQFDKKYGFRRTDLSLAKSITYQLKIISEWNRPEWIHYLKQRIPIISWLSTYDWKHDFISDIIAGLMVSVMFIPQGLAYGLLAGLPPVFGLYTGIINPIVYTLLGTSKHASIGSFAIVSLMVGSVMEQMAAKSAGLSNLAQSSSNELCCSRKITQMDVNETIQISSLITLIVGLIQVILGFLHVGLLAVWLSDQLVEGLTCGAAIHVLVSQLKLMTGLKNMPRTSDSFGIIKFMLCFARNFRNIKLEAAICSLVCCLCLIFSKLGIDQVLNPWMRTKFPMELLLVVFSTLLCYLSFDTPNDLNLEIVGDVDSGMLWPFIPDIQRIEDILLPSFTIAIVSFVIHIALAKLVAKHLDYRINVDQEWLALGISHIISSFFGCMAGGSSLSRTMMNVSIGAKSQLSSIIMVIVLAIVVFGAAPLIKYLPAPVLACIVVVAMKDLYMKIFLSRQLFLQSTVDFCIFLVTLSSVVLINVNVGLLIGIVFALLTVVLRSQWAESTCLGRIPGTSDFKGIGHYRSTIEVPGVKVFRFDAPLYFANAELFLNCMHRATGIDPLAIIAELKDVSKRNKDADPGYGSQVPDEIQLTVRRRVVQKVKSETEPREETHDMVQLTHIIVDCSSFPYIDLMGIEALARAFNEYRTVNITVFFACCKVAVRQSFERSDFYEQVAKKFMFVSIQDAVSQAQYEQEQELGNLRHMSDKNIDVKGDIFQSNKSGPPVK